MWREETACSSQRDGRTTSWHPPDTDVRRNLRSVAHLLLRLQPGVHAALQSGVLGDALQQLDQGFPILGVQEREKFGVVVVGDPPGFAEGLSTIRGEVDCVRAPVRGVAPAFREPLVLEVVDQADHRVAMDVQTLCQLLLSEAAGGREVSEHSEVTWMQAERLKALSKLRGRMKPELGEQETRSLDQFSPPVRHAPNRTSSSLSCSLIIISSAYIQRGLPMKLTVFGPSGGTGQQIVAQALAAGHSVTAVARRPDAVEASGPGLRELVPADLSDAASLREAITGSDAVISALGSRAGNAPTTVYSEGTRAIVAAMKDVGVRRIITISAAPVAPNEQKSFVMRRVADPILYRFFGGGYDDMKRMEAVLAQSDSDWTAFRPPRLTDGRATGKYRMAVDAGLPRIRSISRADLAGAILRAVEDNAVVGHAVTISN